MSRTSNFPGYPTYSLQAALEEQLALIATIYFPRNPYNQGKWSRIKRAASYQLLFTNNTSSVPLLTTAESIEQGRILITEATQDEQNPTVYYRTIRIEKPQTEGGGVLPDTKISLTARKNKHIEEALKLARRPQPQIDFPSILLGLVFGSLVHHSLIFTGKEGERHILVKGGAKDYIGKGSEATVKPVVAGVIIEDNGSIRPLSKDYVIRTSSKRFRLTDTLTPGLFTHQEGTKFRHQLNKKNAFVLNRQPRTRLVIEKGVDLFEWICQQRTFEKETAFNISIWFALGVLALHRQNVSHGDIKPANALALINPDGELQGVRLSDLGLATDHTQDNSLDATKVCEFGTPIYMATAPCSARKADLIALLRSFYMDATTYKTLYQNRNKSAHAEAFFYIFPSEVIDSKDQEPLKELFTRARSGQAKDLCGLSLETLICALFLAKHDLLNTFVVNDVVQIPDQFAIDLLNYSQNIDEIDNHLKNEIVRSSIRDHHFWPFDKSSGELIVGHAQLLAAIEESTPPSCCKRFATAITYFCGLFRSSTPSVETKTAVMPKNAL